MSKTFICDLCDNNCGISDVQDIQYDIIICILCFQKYKLETISLQEIMKKDLKLYTKLIDERIKQLQIRKSKFEKIK